MALSTGQSRIRRYDPSKASGVFIARDIPKRFPLFLGAIMALKAAMNMNSARIRAERENSPEYMEWSVPYVYHEAIRRGLMRTNMGVALPGDIEKRLIYWPGAAFPKKEKNNG